MLERMGMRLDLAVEKPPNAVEDQLFLLGIRVRHGFTTEARRVWRKHSIYPHRRETRQATTLALNHRPGEGRDPLIRGGSGGRVGPGLRRDDGLGLLQSPRFLNAP